MYVVYKVTSPSNKVYVGLTKHGVHKRKLAHFREVRQGSTKPFHNALKKYNDKMIWEVLEDNLNQSQARAYEICYIAFFQSTDRTKGYNLSHGGQGTLKIAYSEDRLRRQKEHLSRIRQAPKCLAKRARSMGGKPFICVETGERFDYLMEAAVKFGTADKNSIYRVLKGKRQSYKGFHFKYVNPERG